MNKKLFFHPYIPASINQVERWLTNMSINGYRLSNLKGWCFFFEKSTSKTRQYFMYSGFDASRGWSYDYYLVKNKYSNCKNMINRLELGVFEVDEKKMDPDFDKFKQSRNTFYKKHYIRLLTFSLVLVALTLSAFLFGKITFFIVLPALFIFIYSLLSIIIISNTGDGSA